MAEPASPEGPRPGIERATGGFVIALFLVAALFLAYAVYRVVQDVRERTAPEPAALVTPFTPRSVPALPAA